MTIEQETQAVPVDPREKEEWFEVLPDLAKNQVRRQWKSDESQARMNEERHRDRFLQALCEGAGLLFCIEFLVYGLTPWSTFVTLGLGSLLGLAWAKWQCGRAVSGLTGMLGFILVRALCGMGLLFYTLLALILVICIATALGISRESSRGGI